MKYQPLSSSLFTGRDGFLNALEKAFVDQGPGQYLRREYLLYRMGGAGKTQIALKFAENHRQRQVDTDLVFEFAVTNQLRTGITMFSGSMQAIEIPSNKAIKLKLSKLALYLTRTFPLQKLYENSNFTKVDGFFCSMELTALRRSQAFFLRADTVILFIRVETLCYEDSLHLKYGTSRK